MDMIDREWAEDGPAIEALLDRSFGPRRQTLSSYALRSGSPFYHLGRVARDHDRRMVGAVRFWPVMVQDSLNGRQFTALLLGPLAIDPSRRGQRLGRALMRAALRAVDEDGDFDCVLLVGSRAYFEPHGFRPVLPRYVTLPGNRDADRLMVRHGRSGNPMPAVGQLVPRLGRVPEQRAETPAPAACTASR
ncbi:GNAT family N-acetyltransferase [Yunchengibacter salinarum]|uniref:GNAT family N-acetyltransferase n=1 Tax=Yunchengibacter salinarum TaxID=3133399 RepID=UPI0035B60C88